MTQQELADLVGVSRQTIMQLERNRYNPSMLLAYSIAKVFGVTMEELQLSYSSIQSVGITEKGTNYRVSITTESDTICLLSPKKGVSAFMGATGTWHMNNIDDTLQMLKSLQGNAADGIK